MKKLLIFIAGILIGIVLTVAFATIITNIHSTESIPGLELFEEKGECVSTKDFQIFQSLGNVGLASEKSGTLYSGLTVYNGLTVLFMNTINKPFYDEQIIAISKGKCAKQVGIYKYETKNNDWKTVPVVILD